MSKGKIAGLLLLAALWLWLCVELIRLGGGITLKNLLIIAMTGIVIFVPLWKRYVAPENRAKKK